MTTMTKIGINLTALQDIQPPELNVNYTAVQFLNNLPQNADTMTGGYFAYIILFTMFVVTYWYLSDKAPNASFRYSDIRALTLSSAITGSLGVMLVMSGFLYSWMAVVFVLLSSLLTNILLIIQDNK